MRSGKVKVVVGLLAIVLIGGLYYGFHNFTTRLATMNSELSQCHKHQDSLAAQLQVVLEYKNRLEKFLQDEKSESKKSADTLSGKIQEEQLLRQDERSESQKKHNAMLQKHNLLQNENDDLKLELDKLSRKHLQVIDDQNRLQSEVVKLQALLDKSYKLNQESTYSKVKMKSEQQNEPRKNQPRNEIEPERRVGPQPLGKVLLLSSSAKPALAANAQSMEHLMHTFNFLQKPDALSSSSKRTPSNYIEMKISNASSLKKLNSIEAALGQNELSDGSEMGNGENNQNDNGAKRLDEAALQQEDEMGDPNRDVHNNIIA